MDGYGIVTGTGEVGFLRKRGTSLPAALEHGCKKDREKGVRQPVVENEN